MIHRAVLSFLYCYIVLFAVGLTCTAQSVGVVEFPQMVIDGYEEDSRTLNSMHRKHHATAFSDCTLWDAWLPLATIWTSDKLRQQYRKSLLERRIDAEGYVSMQQHRGMAHSEGWPFPAWQQSRGMGWFFSKAHEGWANEVFKLKPLMSTEGWDFSGAEIGSIDASTGLSLKATEHLLSITTPACRCPTHVAPFLRLEWLLQEAPPDAHIQIEWLLEGETDWPTDRKVDIERSKEGNQLDIDNIALYRHSGYQGFVTRYRIVISQARGTRIKLKSVMTAIDTRHPITNSNYLAACGDYFAWTRDLEFLSSNIVRMRNALRFSLDEFRVREEKHVQVPWVGHEGRSGLAIRPTGAKLVKHGVGIGNNYWDLLPFGGHDALATLYLFNAVREMARIENDIVNHQEWSVSEEQKFDPEELSRLSDDIRADFGKRFWNDANGRFNGWVDLDGRAYDYGFTFLNLEAIYYGIASEEQARSIFDWIDGKRIVAGDTSTGQDIYHWRFAPRATTRRNVETYCFVWRNPESIPWGGQVQDGGAVLGFSYHDIMARLRTNGAEDAWRRLQEILAWYREVESEGGYRKYYAKPNRGTLQGCSTAGGLGVDCEFYESVLVPQVILYGFLGFDPHGERPSIKPQLPKDWSTLTVTNILYHDQRLDVIATKEGILTVSPSVTRP